MCPVLQSAGDGRVSPLPVRDEAGRAWREGLCGGVGRLQPQLPPVLHEPLDQAEQPLPALPAGVDCAEARKMSRHQHISSVIPIDTDTPHTPPLIY